MNHVVVFDVDGTLFPYGNDLFFDTLQQLLGRDLELAYFFKDGKTLANAEKVLNAAHSALLTKYGHDYFSLLDETGYALCHALLAKGTYYPQAFRIMNDAAARGARVILSTANVTPIIAGAIRAMKNHVELPKNLDVISSSFESPFFANFAENKVLSLHARLGKPLYHFNIDFYCDDIEGNDRALSQVANTTYLVHGQHNAGLVLLFNTQRLFWQVFSLDNAKRAPLI